MRTPSDDASGLDWLLFEQAGILTTAQALRFLTRAQLRHRLLSKRWRTVCRGVLSTFDGELPPAAQLWVAVLAAGPRSILAGLAAAQESGLRGRWWRRTAIDVLRQAHRGAPDLIRRLPLGMPAVVVHRTTLLIPDDLQRGRPHRTSIARSIVDACQWAAADEDAVSIAAAACQQRLVTPDEVRVAVDRQPRAHRRVLLLETLDLAELGATSPPEIAFVKLCRTARLPEPTLQVRRRDASGRTRYLDAYFADFRLHVEIDGAQHMDAQAWAADMERQNDVWISGDRILRFPAFLILTQPDKVLTQLIAALRAAGWAGRS